MRIINIRDYRKRRYPHDAIPHITGDSDFVIKLDIGAIQHPPVKNDAREVIVEFFDRHIIKYADVPKQAWRQASSIRPTGFFIRVLDTPHHLEKCYVPDNRVFGSGLSAAPHRIDAWRPIPAAEAGRMVQDMKRRYIESRGL